MTERRYQANKGPPQKDQRTLVYTDLNRAFGFQDQRQVAPESNLCDITGVKRLHETSTRPRPIRGDQPRSSRSSRHS